MFLHAALVFLAEGAVAARPLGSARPVPFWSRLFLSNSGCYRNPIFFPGRGAAARPGRLPNHTCSLEKGNGRPRRSACRPLLIPAHGG
ncbi:hypothetical protein NDU88_003570 [Pleurodeles waltl]|uniref:Secreted protein n=1 Tax=Pleurodeles waltl TaxID=8319 RepID=A0AAV7VG56_PLEWA|nr:hypothetical protein NDU88_003570 [Pleurodeles waltl]